MRDGLHEGVVDFHVFENLEHKAARIQEPEQVVEQHVAAAVHERLVVADELREPDVVEHVLEDLRGRKHVARDNGGIARGRVAEQKFVGENFPIAVEDGLAC